MKLSELRKLSLDELKVKKKEFANELFNLKFQLHTGRLENTAKLKIVRQSIARVNTIISENRA